MRHNFDPSKVNSSDEHVPVEYDISSGFVDPEVQVTESHPFPVPLIDRVVVRRSHFNPEGVTSDEVGNDKPAGDPVDGWEFDFGWPSDNEAEGQLREGRVRLISIQGTAQPLAWVVSRTRRSRMPLAEFPAAAGPVPCDGPFFDLSMGGEVDAVYHFRVVSGPWLRPATEDSPHFEWPVEFKEACSRLQTCDFGADGNVLDADNELVPFSGSLCATRRTYFLTGYQKSAV